MNYFREIICIPPRGRKICRAVAWQRKICRVVSWGKERFAEEHDPNDAILICDSASLLFAHATLKDSTLPIVRDGRCCNELTVNGSSSFLGQLGLSHILVDFTKPVK
jgi:hypothetical protein